MGKLTARDRVRRALNFEEPDRVPTDLGTTVATGITKGAYHELIKYLELPESTVRVNYLMFQTVTVDHQVLDKLGVDFRPVYYRPPAQNRGSWGKDDSYTNEWGIIVRRPVGGLYYDIVHHPLRELDVEDLEYYPWPDPLDPGRFAGIAEEARELYENTNYALIGPGLEGGFFELAWYLRGFDQFLMDLLINKKFAHNLLRRLLNYRKAMLGRYLEETGKYLDVVYYGDDIAIQTGPMMSIDTYREMLKPYQKELFSFIKERTDAKIFYHTCGNVEPYLEDLIEINLDIINPIQVSARSMDTRLLKEKYGKRLVFWGGVDSQQVLPFGTENDVEEEVKKRIRDLAPGGGYVLNPVHNVQPDVPPRNLVKVFESARKYGVYPINL